MAENALGTFGTNVPYFAPCISNLGEHKRTSDQSDQREENENEKAGKSRSQEVCCIKMNNTDSRESN